MREIKFRCWHNLAKSIWNEKHTKVIEYEAGMIYDEKPGDCLLWKNQGQYIESIMQYTGLKDKNGVEIFEGDVVMGFKPSHGIEKTEIIFDKGSFLFKGSMWPVYYWTIEDSYIEVIGNIYEHPALLPK